MEEDQNYKPSPFPNPTLWLTKFLSLQADIFINCLLALISPLVSILSLLTPGSQTPSPYQQQQPPPPTENVKFAPAAAAAGGGGGTPSKVINGILLVIKKLGFGILAAAYVGMILILLLGVSFLIGFGLVHYWVEEPLNLRERLNFDYSLTNPEAILAFHEEDVYSFNGGQIDYGDSYMRKLEGVPVGHTFYVSLLLLLPDSDYNREVGVFQLNAELIMSNGVVMAKASRPCMLHFSSWPVRLMRTFTMAIPLLLGIKSETQTIIVPMIKHKEGFPRTDAIRITMVPRAGTGYIPQVYEGEIILKSQPPWKKDIVRRWRWTFSVWTSFYVYTMALLVMLFSFRHVLLPVMTRDFGKYPEEYSKMEERMPNGVASVSELLKRWQQSRRKRKERLQLWEIDHVAEYVGSSSSPTSISLTRDDDTCNKSSLEEEIGDSESVCDVAK